MRDTYLTSKIEELEMHLQDEKKIEASEKWEIRLVTLVTLFTKLRQLFDLVNSSMRAFFK